MSEIILNIGKHEHKIVPDEKNNFLAGIPNSAKTLGIIPHDIRVLRHVEMFVSHMCQRKARALRVSFLEEKISKKDLLKEIDLLKELIQFRKVTADSFKIEVALHFAKGFAVPFDRLHFCNGWRAVIFPTI